jgi:hypothetical protein
MEKKNYARPHKVETSANEHRQFTELTRGEHTIVADFDGSPVSFTSDGWINGTQIAKRYGKRLRRWLASPDTVEYMAALAEALKAPDSGGFVRRRSGRGGGIELHPKLAVLLARYCDARFAVWVDLQIDRILRGGFSAWSKAGTDRSSTADREPLLSAAGAIVGRHRLSFRVVYGAFNQFIGVKRMRDMTCAQVAEAVPFATRLLAGNATADDYARIEDRRAKLSGAPAQMVLLLDAPHVEMSHAYTLHDRAASVYDVLDTCGEALRRLADRSQTEARHVA